MILRLLLFVFFFPLLRADSALSPSFLFDIGICKPEHYNLLYLAAQQNHQAALRQLSSTAIQHNHMYWVSKSAEIGSVDSLFFLANNTSEAATKKHYLSQAAQLGHSESQFQLALLTTSSSAKERLLENAAYSGHKKAIVSLYYLLNKKGTADQDNLWFAQAAEIDIDLTSAYADFLWLQQSPEVSIEWLNKQADNPVNEVKYQTATLAADIEHTRWRKPVTTFLDNRTEQPRCAIDIQFIAGSLLAIEQIAELSHRFQGDPRFASFPICFNPPVWLSPEALACSNAADKRLTCSLQAVSELASLTDFTHAIVVADSGIANVHNGVMFLDKQDDYRVFLHELAHFAGFVDEYEVDAQMANKLCTSTQAPNLVYAENKPVLSNTEFARYQTDYEDLVLTKTSTCEQVNSNAYKPVQQTTFMEHHDIGVIPKVYLNIWKDSLNDKLSLTPIYVNFAQWFESNGNHKQAGYWWHKYNKYRS
ncbi:hypothetical protein [Aliiglaciecola sp. NS0011-25]|uniref:hypothetical protein n=1 Tax=Aliiglaciecola sp. NS0011-25 TaxID=3127654 RepID=UPI0031072840